MPVDSVDVIIGCQYGSEAKGLFATYIASHAEPRYDWLMSANTRNAGHTVYVDGKPIVARYLPSAAAADHTASILICAGTQIHRDTLEREIQAFEAAGVPIRPRLFIEPNAGVLLDRHAEAESQASMDVRLGSTCEGVGEAQADRVRRLSPLFRDLYSDQLYLYMDAHRVSGRVLLEVSQGYLLSQLSGFYPYSTSRVVSTAAALSYARLPVRSLRHVYGIFRSYPIRVANRRPHPLDRPGEAFNPKDSSGPMDGLEVGWDEVRVAAGATLEQLPVELSSITKLPRRISKFNVVRARQAIYECDVDRPCLGFLNYIDQSVYESRHLTRRVWEWIHTIEDQIGTKFAILSTGPHTVFTREEVADTEPDPRGHGPSGPSVDVNDTPMLRSYYPIPGCKWGMYVLQSHYCYPMPTYIYTYTSAGIPVIIRQVNGLWY